MTIFAGVINLKSEKIQHEQFNELKSVLTILCPGGRIFENNRKNCQLISIDLGNFDNEAIKEDAQCLTLICGDPLIRDTVGLSRFDDTKVLHQAFKKSLQVSVLGKAKGVFSGLHFDWETNSLMIFTDKLGVRPVYLYEANDVIVFSSLSKSITDLSFVDLEIDLRGTCEKLIFNYSMDHRTSYKQIKLLKGGHVYKISPKGTIETFCYWDWKSIPTLSNVCETTVQEVFQAFNDAVTLRLGGNKDAVAFLSGGLDSRCLVSLLKEQTESLTTFNFSTDESQDKHLASLFAQKAGIHHIEKTLDRLSSPNWSMLMANELAKTERETPFENIKIVWSGDGGSVGMGYVYITRTIIEALSKKDHAKAISEILGSSSTLLKKIFRTKYRNDLDRLLENSVEAEMPSISDDPGKAAYHFFMNNDQRRHLTAHFETIGQHRIEFYLPFFDSNFLQKIFAIPSHEMLYHSFYMRWFEYFPASSREVAWQTYPNHRPCPLEIPANLSYQWENNEDEVSTEDRDRDFKYLFGLLSKRAKILMYISRIKIMPAIMLYWLNIRNNSYLVEMLRRFEAIVEGQNNVASKT